MTSELLFETQSPRIMEQQFDYMYISPPLALQKFLKYAEEYITRFTHSCGLCNLSHVQALNTSQTIIIIFIYTPCFFMVQ